MLSRWGHVKFWIQNRWPWILRLLDLGFIRDSCTPAPFAQLKVSSSFNSRPRSWPRTSCFQSSGERERERGKLRSHLSVTCKLVRTAIRTRHYENHNAGNCSDSRQTKKISDHYPLFHSNSNVWLSRDSPFENNNSVKIIIQVRIMRQPLAIRPSFILRIWDETKKICANLNESESSGAKSQDSFEDSKRGCTQRKGELESWRKAIRWQQTAAHFR